ncbi:MAG: hypothetical protein SGARI_007937, partial [Bacillariaceae sp.]
MVVAKSPALVNQDGGIANAHPLDVEPSETKDLHETVSLARQHLATLNRLKEDFDSAEGFKNQAINAPGIQAVKDFVSEKLHQWIQRTRDTTKPAPNKLVAKRSKWHYEPSPR